MAFFNQHIFLFFIPGQFLSSLFLWVHIEMLQDLADMFCTCSVYFTTFRHGLIPLCASYLKPHTSLYLKHHTPNTLNIIPPNTLILIPPDTLYLLQHGLVSPGNLQHCLLLSSAFCPPFALYHRVSATDPWCDVKSDKVIHCNTKPQRGGGVTG